MRKATVLLLILALAFMAAPALAYTVPLPPGLANEVANGDFQTGNFNGWQNTNFFLLRSGTDWITFSSVASGFPMSTMYQVIDESLYNGWIANGDGKQWWLSFQYRSTVASTTAKAYAYYYSSNPDTQPVFGGPGDPGAGWELLYSSGDLPLTSTSLTTVQVNGEVEGFQPRWIAVAFEGQSGMVGAGTYTVSFDDIEFYGKCGDPVPVPPSALLLGSALLGMVGVRFGRTVNLMNSL